MNSNILRGRLSSFIILLVGIIFICGCVNQQAPNLDTNLSNETILDINISNDAFNGSVIEPPLEYFGVAVHSFTCKWTVKMNEYNVKSDCVQAIVKGTAIGPVGSRVELPLAVWSDDNWDCGLWTHEPGALIATGHTCIREIGQPEATNWTVDTGSDNCPLKDYFNNERSYTAKIYHNKELEPKQADSKEVVCQ